MPGIGRTSGICLNSYITAKQAGIQHDQINMAGFFWYLIKNDLSGVGYCTGVHWTSNFLQGTRKTLPCITGHPVYIVMLLDISRRFCERKNI